MYINLTNLKTVEWLVLFHKRNNNTNDTYTPKISEEAQ